MKKATLHTEIIISFAIFIIMVGFAFYYFNPVIQKKLPDVLLDVVEKSLEKNSLVELTEIPLIVNLSSANIVLRSGEREIPVFYWTLRGWAPIAYPNISLENFFPGYLVCPFARERTERCFLEEDKIECGEISCSIFHNHLICQNLMSWCPFFCFHIENHSLLDIKFCDNKTNLLIISENKILKFNSQSNKEFNIEKKRDFYKFFRTEDCEFDYVPLEYENCLRVQANFSIPRKEKIYSYSKLKKIEFNYKKNYEELKEKLDIPRGGNFALSFRLINGTKIIKMERKKPEKVIVKAKEKFVHVLYNNSKVFMILNLQVW